MVKKSTFCKVNLSTEQYYCIQYLIHCVSGSIMGAYTREFKD